MRKLNIGFLAVCAAAAVAAVIGTSMAQPKPATAPASPTKVAVCNVLEIFAGYQKAKDQAMQFEERQRSLQNENEQRGRAIQAIEAELGALKEGSSDYQARLDEMQRLTIERKNWREMQEQLLLRDQHATTRQLYDDIKTAVAAVAQDRGYQIVLYADHDEYKTKEMPELMRLIDSRKVLYADGGVDITEAVLMRVNEAYRR